jgi:hypothetical protein
VSGGSDEGAQGRPEHALDVGPVGPGRRRHRQQVAADAQPEAAAAVLPGNPGGRTERFGLAGTVLVTAGLGALVLGLVQVARHGWAAWASLLAAAALLLAFARRQATRPYAVVPARLLRDRAVLGGNVVGLLLGRRSGHCSTS